MWLAMIVLEVRQFDLNVRQNCYDAKLRQFLTVK